MKGKIYEANEDSNLFFIELKNLLNKHKVSIAVNSHDDSFFFVVNKKLTSYPAHLKIEELGIKKHEEIQAFLIE